MKLHPRLSRAVVELVTRFETFQPLARPAAEGGWTVGYGHTRSAREGARVTRADAEALLLYDLDAACGVVERALFAPASQRQFEALTAFCFNIGADNFSRSSALARLNAGAALDAADEIERWRHAELGAGAQVVDALVRRRAAEKAHFLGLPEGFSKSPSAVLRPLADGDEAAPHGATVSATLTAANTVQARLRELVPDGPVDVPAPSTHPSMRTGAAESSPEPEAPPFPDAGAIPTLDEDHTALAPAPIIEPDLPEVANDAAPPPPPVHAEAPVAPATTIAEPPSPPVPPALKPGLGWEGRPAYALLAGVGVCLFVFAAVLILSGKPGLANLALGVVGVLLLAPGVYGLLGPKTGSPAGTDRASADQPPDVAS